MIQIEIDDSGLKNLKMCWKSETERTRLYFILPVIREHLEKLETAIVKDSMKMVLLSALRSKKGAALKDHFKTQKSARADIGR